MSKSGIKIKKENRGKFTAWAKRHGFSSVQAAARHVLANKDKYSTSVVQQANFARNAAKWKKQYGGDLRDQVVNKLIEGIYNFKPNVDSLYGKGYAEMVANTTYDSAYENNLDPYSMLVQMAQESAFNPTAASPAGAFGIAQFMPNTMNRYGISPQQAANPEVLIPLMGEEMSGRINKNYRKYGDDSYAAAQQRYNVGGPRFDAWKKGKRKLPKETANYPKKIDYRMKQMWGEKPESVDFTYSASFDEELLNDPRYAVTAKRPLPDQMFENNISIDNTGVQPIAKVPFAVEPDYYIGKKQKGDYLTPWEQPLSNPFEGPVHPDYLPWETVYNLPTGQKDDLIANTIRSSNVMNLPPSQIELGTLAALNNNPYNIKDWAPRIGKYKDQHNNKFNYRDFNQLGIDKQGHAIFQNPEDGIMAGHHYFERVLQGEHPVYNRLKKEKRDLYLRDFRNVYANPKAGDEFISLLNSQGVKDKNGNKISSKTLLSDLDPVDLSAYTILVEDRKLYDALGGYDGIKKVISKKKNGGYAKTKEDYELGLLKGKNKFKFNNMGPHNMTMTPNGYTIPFPVMYQGFAGGHLVDQGVALPGENFNVFGDFIQETPMMKYGGYPKYQTGDYSTIGIPPGNELGIFAGFGPASNVTQPIPTIPFSVQGRFPTLGGNTESVNEEPGKVLPKKEEQEDTFGSESNPQSTFLADILGNNPFSQNADSMFSGNLPKYNSPVYNAEAGPALTGMPNSNSGVGVTTVRNPDVKVGLGNWNIPGYYDDNDFPTWSQNFEKFNIEPGDWQSNNDLQWYDMPLTGAYNTIKGLVERPEVEGYQYNQYAPSALGRLDNLRYTPDFNPIRAAYNTGRNTINNASTSNASRIANQQAALSNTQAAMNQAIQQGETMNNQYETMAANAWLQEGTARAAERARVTDRNIRHKSTKDDYLNEGFKNIEEKLGVGIRALADQRLNNELAVASLNMQTANYKLVPGPDGRMQLMLIDSDGNMVPLSYLNTNQKVGINLG
jgi:hypothetical protein